MPSGLRVGLDLVTVEDVEASLTTHGDHYLRRVYTAAEVDDCGDDPRTQAARLAARFAAKEATLKVLRPDDEPVGWPAIEVRREPGGWPSVSLSGAAAELATAQGIIDIEISLTHEGAMAAAVAVARCASAEGKH